jgi:hypothetical protein
MKQASTLSHEDLYFALRDGELDAESFDHESHIRLAWYYLTRWPYAEALVRFNQDFFHFIVSAGARSKFHKTITEALLQLISSHLGDEQCRKDWEYFKRDAEPLFTDAFGLLKRFYSADLLTSEAARHDFKDPDIKKMPQPS